MKIIRIIPALACTGILVVVAGCNDLGEQLAKVLPENGGPSLGNGQLSQSGDANSIDPTRIGGGNSSMAQPTDNDHGSAGGMNEMNEIMPEMLGDGGLDFADDEPMLMEQPVEIFDGDGMEDAEMQMLARADLAEDNVGFGNMEKPSNDRRPQKQFPSKGSGNGPQMGSSASKGIPNIRDRPTKTTGNKPFGASNIPQKPATGSNAQNPRTGRPTSQPNAPAVGIRMPGKVVNPVFSLIDPVAVPVLLQNGTAMSFSTEMLQQRNLASRGTVYWVVHSQRLGFSPLAVPRSGGRVSGVVAKFTPTSGPFKTFIVVVEADGQIEYLSAAVDIKWNP